MPRVPSADYSPIEAANQARANARKIGYYAADASNWKQKHDRNVKSMELQSKSLDIQAEGLEFNKWMNVVNTVLGVASQGVDFAKNVYDWKVNNAQNELNAYVQTSSDRMKQTLALYGDKIEVRKNDDGSIEVVKPQALIDLEKEINAGLQEMWIPDELKPSVQAAMSQMFSDTELVYLQSAITKEQAAQQSLFEHNLDNAVKADIANGLASPVSALALIDSNTELTETEKELKRESVVQDFTTGLAKNEVQRKAREEGYDAAYSYIGTLPSDLFDATDKATLRGLAESTVSGVVTEAENLATSFWTQVEDGNQVIDMSTLKAAYDDIDVRFSDSNGYSSDFREAYRNAMQTAQKSWADSTITDTLSTQLQNSKTPWTVLQNTAEALSNPDSQIYSWYYGLDADRQTKLAQINNQLNEYKKVYGNLLETNFASDATSLMRQYKNNEIDAKTLWQGIDALYSSYSEQGITQLTDFDMFAYWQNLADDMFAESGVSRNSIASDIEKVLQSTLEYEDFDKLSPEQQGYVITAQQAVYAKVTDWLKYNLGNFNSQEYADFITATLSGYDAEYFDMLDRDPETSGVFSQDFQRSAEVFTTGLDKGLISIDQDAVTEAGYIDHLTYKDGNVRNQANEAFTTIREHMDNNVVDAGLKTSDPQIKLADDGHILLEYEGNDGSTWVFDTNTAKATETVAPEALRQELPTDDLEVVTDVDSSQAMQLGAIESRLGIIRTEVETEMDEKVEGDSEYRIDDDGNVLVYFRLHDGSFVSYDEKTGRMDIVNYLDNPRLLKPRKENA